MHPGVSYQKGNPRPRGGRGGGGAGGRGGHDTTATAQGGHTDPFQNQSGGAPRQGNRGGRGGGGGGVGVCFNCGRPGHVSRDCPTQNVNRGGYGGRGGGGRGGGGSGNCFNCGKPGHMSRDCAVPIGNGGGPQGGGVQNSQPAAGSTVAGASHPSAQPMPTEDDVNTWRQKDFHALVKAFAENDKTPELVFPANLNPTQRNTLHRIAMVFGLEHKSYGVAPNRRLTLSKASGTVAMQQLREDAAANGERIKTVDGYQGAQMLPDEFIDRSKLDEISKSLHKHRNAMLHDIQMEANRPNADTKNFRTAQPGLSAPPHPKRDDKSYQDLQRFRKTLPAYKRRDDIVSAVRDNDVVIVSGDTGCGKTTQIPQMLFDANIFPAGSDIVCTQPRRISALSVANRVAEERGESCGDSCGYVIRFENMTSRNSRIIYQTTGILLRRLHSEPELRGVACVIVDEVHERDLDTDFSLLLLRDRLEAQRAEPHKYPQKLKLVVMSATVQIETLVNYFNDFNSDKRVPLISIPGTLFPVSEFYLEDAIAWVGGSQSGANAMAFLESKQQAAENKVDTEDMNFYEKLRSSVFNDQHRDAEAMVPYDLLAKLIVYIHQGSRDLSGSILVFLPGWAAITRIADMLRRSDVARELSVLMLHSSLTSAEQQRVFLPPPKRYRKVVLATSIAETSITIDDVVYVIDSGLIKGTSYDPSGNTSVLLASLISKANGIQRRGRAGRCREGVCVHLLPRSVYNSLPDFLPPEIVRSPLEEICLQVKAIRSDERCASVLARAMDPPPDVSVNHAVAFLTEMGAFTEEEELLTNLGRALAQLPLHPLLGKMLFAASIFGVLDSVATIAAGLSVKSPFVKPMSHQRAACRESLQHIDAGDLSDHLCVMKLHRGWVQSGRSFQYCTDHFADQSTLRSLDRTKQQLVRLVQQSPMLRRWRDPLREASRNNGNTGLVRLTMLWSLYPRIATLEYRANRNDGKANVFCWDNKPATFSMSSALAFGKRREYGTNSFVVYYERMQLESMLNLFDSSIVSAVDVAMCIRQLIVRPLEKIPDFLLRDKESKLAAPMRMDIDLLEDKDKYAGLLFDGDKKLYIAEKKIAAVLELGRQCMDYYLALCIKKLRADAFPQDLVKSIALLIGFPLSDVQAATALTGFDSEAMQAAVDCASPRPAGNLPAFARGGGPTSGDSSDDDEGPIIMDDDSNNDAATRLQLTDAQRRKVTSAFGDLAVLRQAQVVGLDDPHPVRAAPAANNDDDDDEDMIVAKPGALEMQPHTHA